MRSRWLGLVLVVGLVVAACGGAEPEAGGPSEGIQVHGDWVIDVYNQDGSLDHHVEFENALTPAGGEDLARVLAGLQTVGDWEIEIQGDVGPCPSVAGLLCRTGVVEAQWLDGTPTLRLQGSSQIEADDTIIFVGTRLGICDADTTPNGCTRFINSFNFTSHFLAPADQPAVTSGQTVDIQVDISFS